jgi:hypothetical protein
MYAIYAGAIVKGDPQLDYINSFESEAEALMEAKRLSKTYSEIEMINEASKELVWNYSSTAEAE